MPISITPNLGLKLLEQNMASKEILINEALYRIDALLHNGIISASITIPPGSPTASDCYIVPSGATGAWAGQDNKLTYYDTNAGWLFVTPREGATLWVNDVDALYSYNGSGWTPFTIPTSVSQFGVNTTANSTDKLSVKSASSLFDNIGAGTQIKINKLAATDTASTLFQTAGSGRAELCTSGDNDLRFKVSPDGSTWHEALCIDNATGILEVKKRIHAEAGISFDNGTNTLSNYETGTFTPSIKATSTNPTVTYTTQAGRYTRIGNRVFGTLHIVTSAFTGGSGTAFIDGFPFTVKTGTECRAGAALNNGLSTGINVSGTANATGVCGFFLDGINQFRLYRMMNNGTSSVLALTQFSAANTIFFTFSYEIN